MRIVCYLFADGFTGAAKIGVEVVKSMAADARTVVFARASRPGPIEECANRSALRVFALPPARGPAGKVVAYVCGLVLTAASAIAHRAATREIVIVYAATVYAAPLALLAWCPGVKVVLHLHEVGTGRRWLDKVFFAAGRCADEIVCVSAFHAGEVRRLLPPGAAEKVRIIDNGVEVRVQGRGARNTRTDAVIYVGGATVRKGIRVVAELARRLSSKEDRWQLCLSSAGRVDSDSVAALEELPFVEVAWDVRDVQIYWQRARVAIVPTVPALCAETFGLVIVEAVANGCQVVSSGSGAYPETIAALGSGEVLQGRTERELIDAYCEVLPGFCAQPADVTPARLEKYSVSRMHDQWKTLLAAMSTETSSCAPE